MRKKTRCEASIKLRPPARCDASALLSYGLNRALESAVGVFDEARKFRALLHRRMNAITRHTDHPYIDVKTGWGVACDPQETLRGVSSVLRASERANLLLPTSGSEARANQPQSIVAAHASKASQADTSGRLCRALPLPKPMVLSLGM